MATNFDLKFILLDGSQEFIRTKEQKVCTEFYLMFQSSK